MPGTGLTELRDEPHSDSPEINEWAISYLDDKESYYEELLDLVTATVDGGSAVLEVGSAPCQFTALLESAGFDVTGVDIDPSRFTPLIESLNLDVVACDIEKERLPFESDSFDLVILTEVLEHLRIDPLNTLREIRRVLSDSGKLLLTTPNQYHLPAVWEFLKGNGSISFAHEQFSKIERLGHMGHVREYAPADLRDLLEKEGFLIESHSFSDFGKAPAQDRPILGRLATEIQNFIPFTRRVQIVVASI